MSLKIRSMMHSEWILQHGWGFDHTFWSIWIERIPSNVFFKICDRGYFGYPIVDVAFRENVRHKVLVAHSFGLFLLPENLIKSADFLFILGGFSSLYSKEPKERQRITTALHLMLENVVRYPEKVLESFYKKSFYPQNIDYQWRGGINQQLLLQDLQNLSLPLKLSETINHIPHICIVHGENDAIVSKEISLNLHQQLPHSKWMLLNQVGHAFPWTHPNDIILKIQSSLSFTF